MPNELIKAHLNLYAVLQNLEDLVRLDDEMALLVRDWNISIQFSVHGGPTATLSFAGGLCRHEIGAISNPTVKLYFLSPGHLNSMFGGKGTPIPLKGFGKLGFMQKDFPKLTDRLEYYLKPDAERLADEKYVRINTILTLNTAMCAVKVLAALEPLSKKIAAHIPRGTLQVEVMPEGPWVSACFGTEGITIKKSVEDKPSAKMTFRNMSVANALLAGKLDAFLAVAQGDVILEGQLPIIDNVNLILDRVPAYLS
jgi:hypothetical protein